MNMRNACILFTLCCFLILANIAFANSELKHNNLEYVGMTGDGLYLFYIDIYSIAKNKVENTVSFIGMKKLSDIGKAAKRKDFEESVERAEKETGSKVEDKDKLFDNVILPMSVRQDRYEINCGSMEIRSFSPHTPGTIGIVIVDKIIEGSAEYGIYKKYCKDLKNQ